MNIKHDTDQEPIIAQCTPRGAGALALLRLTGAQAFHIADTFCRLPSQKKISELPTHTIHYGAIVDQKNVVLDNVMFIVMHGPKTFTGQDTVEITCHNNLFIIEAIIEQAIINGARLAQEGEFSKRAYLSGKIDLVQAEAINELIHANTQMGLKKSLAQLEGSLSKWISTIEQDLIKALALSDASFEFIDDELSFGDQIHTIVSAIIDITSSLKKTFNQQQHIRQGVRIALIGSVNAGKSSLFNALLNRNRAIVTPMPGTTRDALEAGLYRNGIYWTLIDTAGLRQTDDVIEIEGISRSHQEAKAADLIILVMDSARLITEQEKQIYQEISELYSKKIILVHNKTDLPRKLTQDPAAFLVSNTDQATINLLEKRLEGAVLALFNGIESPFLLNQRQFNLLLGLEKKLITIQSMLCGHIEYELISYDLKDAIALLSELTGKSISEQGMDAVFRTFCIGK